MADFRGIAILALLLSTAPAICAEQKARSGKKTAVLIGVKRYDSVHLSNLYHSESDVVELGKVLKTQGFEVTLLSDSQPVALRPTRVNIQKHLEQATNERNPEDSVLIAFAGHGLQFAGEKSSYFVPYGADPTDSATMISLEAVYALLGRCAAETKLLLVDACRTHTEKKRFRAALDDHVPEPPAGVCALFSCSAGQSAMEMNDLRHGLFFYHVLRGLEGQARDSRDEVTVLGLAQHAMRRVKESGYNQTPVIKGEITDRTLVHVTPAFLAELAKSRKAGSEAIDALGMRFVWVPPGAFTMGAPSSEAGRSDDETQKAAKIDMGFHIGKHEVTVGEFREFVRATGYKTEAEADGEGGWGFDAKIGKLVEGRDPRFSWQNTGWKQSEQHPVVNVSWNDANAYCEWLSRRENRRYTLPTEAEWEYACRAGTQTAYHYGAGVKDWKVRGNVGTGKFTCEVGLFPPNAWGICDLHGNVAEWCADVAEPKPSGNKRVLRGGSWHDGSSQARSAFRNFNPPSARRHDIGFRLALRDR